MLNILHKDDVISMNLARKIASALEPLDIQEELVIAVGGDGTILRAVHQFYDQLEETVIFGVRSGHLGFFTDFTEESIDDLIQAIKNKTYLTHSFTMGRAIVHHNDGTKSKYRCLNEFQIADPYKLVVFDVYFDGIPFETFRGNGLCFSTPAGSTGLNKSLGGAVMDPYLNGMQMTELAAINSNAYRTISSPLIFSNERSLELVPVDQEHIHFTYDHLQAELEDVQKVEIRSSEKKVVIGFAHDNPFFERVRKSFL